MNKQNSLRLERIGSVGYKTFGGRTPTCLVVEMADILTPPFSPATYKGGKYE